MGGCLKDRWRPWNSTWIPSDSPPLALGSNDVTLGFDRFQVLNGRSGDIWGWRFLRWFAYGKFLFGAYPLQLWEPQDQVTISNYAKDFMSGAHLQNPSLGFDFAINTDPNMWMVFAAEQTRTAWNAELVLSELCIKASVGLARKR